MRRFLSFIALIVLIVIIVGVFLNTNQGTDSQNPTNQNSPAFPEPTFEGGDWHFEVANVTSGDLKISQNTKPIICQDWWVNNYAKVWQDWYGGWSNVSFRKINLSFHFTFREKELSFCIESVINRTLRLLANLGIEAVKETPVDAYILVSVNAKAKWANYNDERSRSLGGEGTPYPTGAEAGYGMFLSAPDGLGILGSVGSNRYSTQFPETIYGTFSIYSCPVEEPIVEAMDDCFKKAWG